MTNLMDIYRKIGGILNPDDLDKLVRDLHEKRQTVERIHSGVKELQNEINESDLGVKLKAARTELTTAHVDLEEIDSKLRQVALDVYEQTQDTKPLGSRIVQIKLYTTVDYDPDKALDYSRQHLRAAVKLNRQKFNKLAKGLELDFVTVGKEPRATVARDLSQFLEDD